jgi:hypothetical protein
MGKNSKQGPRFSATLAMFWRSLCRDAFDSYRPELHYMRGPGPKWRAKHGIAEHRTAAPASAVVHSAALAA